MKNSSKLLGPYNYRLYATVCATVLIVSMAALVLTGCPQSEGGTSKQTPVAGDYNIGNMTQTAGSVTAVTITAKAGKSTGAITIYYDGSATLPTAAGAYAVTFDVAAATGWNAANGLSAGTLTINPAGTTNQTPVAGDYTIGNLSQTAGSVTAVTITAKAGKSTGAITIYYDGSTTLPTAAGTYAVTFNVAAATGWNAASELSAGNLVIHPVGENMDPETSDYNIGNLTQTAGSVTAVTITAKTGKSTGAITIYYNGSTTLPTAAGTYAVTFNVAAATGWNAASGLSAGTLTISPANGNTPVITITTQPAATTNVTAGGISGSLTITATATESATLGYQWYSNTSDSNNGGSAVDGATGDSFTIPTDLTEGTYYYFCEVSAAGATSVRSDVATVTVGSGTFAGIGIGDPTIKLYLNDTTSPLAEGGSTTISQGSGTCTITADGYGKWYLNGKVVSDYAISIVLSKQRAGTFQITVEAWTGDGINTGSHSFVIQ